MLLHVVVRWWLRCSCGDWVLQAALKTLDMQGVSSTVPSCGFCCTVFQYRFCTLFPNCQQLYYVVFCQIQGHILKWSLVESVTCVYVKTSVHHITVCRGMLGTQLSPHSTTLLMWWPWRGTTPLNYAWRCAIILKEMTMQKLFWKTVTGHFVVQARRYLPVVINWEYVPCFRNMNLHILERPFVSWTQLCQGVRRVERIGYCTWQIHLIV